jgi:hypothetical protein
MSSIQILIFASRSRRQKLLRLRLVRGVAKIRSAWYDDPLVLEGLGFP